MEPASMSDDEYRELFQRLCHFFEWHHCAAPEDLAQETIIRGLRRLEEGEVNYAGHKHGYFFGIAQNVRREQWKVRSFDPIDEVAASGENNAVGVQSWIFLRESLDQLDADDRELIESYAYDGVDATAAMFQITPNAVRVRVSRIRRRIKQAMLNPGARQKKKMK